MRTDALVGTPVVEPILDDAAAAHATLVNRARAALVGFGTAVTVAELAEATGRSKPAVRRWVAHKRDDRRLVAATQHDGTLLIPTVQLDEAFTLNEPVADVRLIDLRDPPLDRFGTARDQLIATAAVHYRCTRTFARHVHGRVIGGQQTHGMVWHFRQTELHARALADRPAVADLVDEHPTEVAVVWSPPADRPLPEPTDGGWDYIEGLIALLNIVTPPD